LGNATDQNWAAASIGEVEQMRFKHNFSSWKILIDNQSETLSLYLPIDPAPQVGFQTLSGPSTSYQESISNPVWTEKQNI